MRINQLGLQVELESIGNFDIFGTETHEESLALANELTGEERIQNGVNFLANGVNEEHLSVRNGKLDLLLPARSSQLNVDHLRAFLALDPLDTLQLGIDHERVSRAGHHNGGVLERNSISGQVLSLPDGSFRSGRQNFKRVHSLRERNAQLSNVRNPSVNPQVVAEFEREWSNV